MRSTTLNVNLSQDVLQFPFPVYASLGDDALVHALGETEVKTVVADLKLMGKLAKVADKLTTIERVIYFDDINPDSEIFTHF